MIKAYSHVYICINTSLSSSSSSSSSTSTSSSASQNDDQMMEKLNLSVNELLSEKIDAETFLNNLPSSKL